MTKLKQWLNNEELIQFKTYLENNDLDSIAPLMSQVFQKAEPWQNTLNKYHEEPSIEGNLIIDKIISLSSSEEDFFYYKNFLVNCGPRYSSVIRSGLHDLIRIEKDIILEGREAECNLLLDVAQIGKDKYLEDTVFTEYLPKVFELQIKKNEKETKEDLIQRELNHKSYTSAINFANNSSDMKRILSAAVHDDEMERAELGFVFDKIINNEKLVSSFPEVLNNIAKDVNDPVLKYFSALFLTDEIAQKQALSEILLGYPKKIDIADYLPNTKDWSIKEKIKLKLNFLKRHGIRKYLSGENREEFEILVKNGFIQDASFKLSASKESKIIEYSSYEIFDSTLSEEGEILSNRLSKSHIDDEFYYDLLEHTPICYYTVRKAILDEFVAGRLNNLHSAVGMRLQEIINIEPNNDLKDLLLLGEDYLVGSTIDSKNPSSFDNIVIPMSYMEAYHPIYLQHEEILDNIKTVLRRAIKESHREGVDLGIRNFRRYYVKNTKNSEVRLRKFFHKVLPISNKSPSIRTKYDDIEFKAFFQELLPLAESSDDNLIIYQIATLAGEEEIAQDLLGELLVSESLNTIKFAIGNTDSEKLKNIGKIAP